MERRSLLGGRNIHRDRGARRRAPMGENSKAEAIASKFWMLGLLNGLLAVVFTIPIVVPSLCIATPPGEFGCAASMETTWPGTWLLVAFFTWTTVGVLGA